MAGIYIHIPLCKQRCYYCDFYSTCNLEQADDYVRAVVGECALRIHELCGEPVTTLYVGGGTPSVLTQAQFRTLVNGLCEHIDMGAIEEFTVEVNPDDVTPQLVENLREAGVNRVSMGVQSFVDRELRQINRRHNAAQASEAVSTLHRGGIDNVSIDIIYGLPGQTLDTLRYSVEQAIACAPRHVSAYCLSYEQDTPLWKMRERGEVKEASDELCLAMYELIRSLLTDAGFLHYEISNYALPGCQARHNSAYWDGTSYLGLGAAAHSYDGNRVRRYNPSDMVQYVEAINRGTVCFHEEQESLEECINDHIMVRLRTSQGLDTEQFKQRFGVSALNCLLTAAKQHLERGLMDNKNGILRITPQGVMLSDAIISDLFVS